MPIECSESQSPGISKLAFGRSSPSQLGALILHGSVSFSPCEANMARRHRTGVAFWLITLNLLLLLP